MRRTIPIAYLLPNPNASDVEWSRFHHLDLEAMDAFDLWREKRQTEYALAYWPHRDEVSINWLLAHLTAIRQEYVRRRYGVR